MIVTAPAFFEYSGTLLHTAEARTRLLDGHEHAVPVIYMEIELDNSLHSVMHVEQPFPPEHHKEARAAAHRLKKGTHVTVQVPPLDLRLIARNAAHIHVIKDQSQEPTAP